MSILMSLPLSIDVLPVISGIYGYGLLVLMVLLCLWLWRKKKKARNEEWIKIWICACVATAFCSILFCSFDVFTSLPIEFQTENGDAFMKAMVSLLPLFIIIYFILKWYYIGRNKVKIDSIKYWLDRRDGTAKILPDNYSGDIVIPSSVITPKGGVTYRVTDFDKNAFFECDELTSVTIPDGVTSISNSAFSGCKVLKSILVSRSVTSIGYDPFLKCINLTSIKVVKGNPNMIHGMTATPSLKRKQIRWSLVARTQPFPKV